MSVEPVTQQPPPPEHDESPGTQSHSSMFLVADTPMWGFHVGFWLGEPKTDEGSASRTNHQTWRKSRLVACFSCGRYLGKFAAVRVDPEMPVVELGFEFGHCNII